MLRKRKESKGKSIALTLIDRDWSHQIALPEQADRPNQWRSVR